MNVEHWVIELCPYCDTEINMNWDVQKYGYKVFCPYCGNRLMLCDECMHGDDEATGGCDYNSDTDSCRFGPLRCSLFYCNKRQRNACCHSCPYFQECANRCLNAPEKCRYSYSSKRKKSKKKKYYTKTV